MDKEISLSLRIADICPQCKFVHTSNESRCTNCGYPFRRQGFKYSVGDVIKNRFKVLDIKKGGMGIVYLCEDIIGKKNFAVKTILSEYSKNIRIRSLFKKEASMWLSLDEHPNIVTVVFIDDLDSFPHIFMEWIQGKPNYGSDLGSLLKLGYKFSFDEILFICTQFCDGMMYVIDKYKSRGKFVHRDIKPSNLLITEDMILKISDFSFSLGTKKYMSPEQKEAIELDMDLESNLDERSDIYSFGLVLKELLDNMNNDKTRQKIMEEITSDNTVQNLISQKVQENLINPHINFLNGLTIMCLERDRNKRFQTFKELREFINSHTTSTVGNIFAYRKDIEIEWWQWINKGASLSALKEYDEALKCLDIANELKPNNSDIYANQAYLLWMKGRFFEALNIVDKALEITPDDAEIINTKGLILLDLNRKEEAIDQFIKATELKPDYMVPLLNIGYYYEEIGRYDLSIQYYDKVIEKNHRHATALFDKANALLKLGKYKEAIVFYDKSLEIDCENAKAWYNKGISLMRLNQITQSIPLFEKALKIAPQDYKVWLNTASAYFALDLNRESLNFCSRAIELKSDYFLAWNLRGMNYLFLHEPENAYNSFENAISIYQDDLYVFLYQLICSFKLSQDKFNESKNRIKINLPRFQNNLWGLKLAELMIDCVSVDALLSNVDTEQKKTEANTFIGYYFLFRGQNDRAREHFLRCVAVNQQDQMEYKLSKMELENL